MFFNIKDFFFLYKNNFFNNYLLISENFFFIEEVKFKIKKISKKLNIYILSIFLKNDIKEILKYLNINKNIFSKKELIIIYINNINFCFKSLNEVLKKKNKFTIFFFIINYYKILINKFIFNKIFFKFICLKYKFNYYIILIRNKIFNLNLKNKIKKYFLNKILKNKIIINSNNEFYKIYFSLLNKKINIFYNKKINIFNNKKYINKINFIKFWNNIYINKNFDNILKNIFFFIEKNILNHKYKFLIKIYKKIIYLDFKIKNIRIYNIFNYNKKDALFIIIKNIIKYNKFIYL